MEYVRDLIGETTVKTYHEPFLGGAAMFLGLSLGGKSRLSDLNAELIETYTQIQEAPEAVAELLATHKNGQQHYYRVRSHEPADPVERAARFIYLNHTSFNGIYRVNLSGQYNVPFGNRESPNFPSLDDLNRVSVRLKAATLKASDFKTAILRVKEDDFVFLDPPYTVAHNHNGFVKYNQKLFSFEDQRELRSAIATIRSAGAHYVMTNAAHDSIADLFGTKDARVEMSRKNAVGGKKAVRGTATEYLYTNLAAS